MSIAYPATGILAPARHRARAATGLRGAAVPVGPPPSPLECGLIARQIARTMPPAGWPGSGLDLLLAIADAAWLRRELASIEAYRDPPRPLDELQLAVDDPRPGYHIHHIVERTPAARDGFSRSLIHRRDNLVRIPAYRHEEITAWFATVSPLHGYLSPRDYLRGRTWEEHRTMGLAALRAHLILT